jgi:hypothetical protein
LKKSSMNLTQVHYPRKGCSGIGLGDLDGDGDLDAFVAQGNLGQDSGGGLPNEVWFNEKQSKFFFSYLFYFVLFILCSLIGYVA